MNDEQQSRHESDSSSLADEKEIHNKLTQIMNLIGDQSNRDADGDDLVRSEEEFTQEVFARNMSEEVLEEAGSDDLDMYQIQADELFQEEVDVDAEIQKLALEYAFEDDDEEEKRDEEQDEAERLFQERASQILELAAQFTPSTLTGDYKAEDAGYYGGFECKDKALLSKQRSAATEIVKMVGKKLFSGSSDLTKISFPIKCMTSISTLELMPTLQSTMNVLINRAAMETDPVERMKLTIAHNISFFYKEKIFEKPLNPILGETYQARG